MTKFIRPNKTRLKNPQHYEFVNAFITSITSANLSATKISTLVTRLSAAFQEEDRWYMISRASDIIAQRETADRQRDFYYVHLHRLVQAWTGTGEPTMDPAATLLKKDFNLYKVQTAAQLEVQSGQMSNLITELLKSDRQAAITALNGQYLFTQMKTAHETVQSLRLEQGVEESQKELGALKQARKSCDALYDEITYLIEAFALTADDSSAYETFIQRWNGTLKIYQDMLDRKNGSEGSGSSGSSGSSSGSGDSAGSGDSGSTGDTGDQGDGGSGSGGTGSSDGGGGDDTGGGGGTETPSDPTDPENPGGGSEPDPDNGME